MTTFRPKDSFSSSYAEARDRFLESAARAGAQLIRYEHPDSGPAGETLSTDVAVLGGSAPKSAAIFNTGIHGVEGFVGSAISVDAMRSGRLQSLSDDVRVVFVHALNPYGFAWGRRVDEDNVDVNRNFIDFDGTLPSNEHYDALAEAIAPPAITPFERVRSLARLLGYRARHGRAAAQAAISKGQFDHPKGLFFGGQRQSWSNRTLRTLLRAVGDGVEHIAFVDIHSGLGARGGAEAIHGYPASSIELARARAMWGSLCRNATEGEASGPALSGTAKSIVDEMLPDATVTAMTLELGTEPGLKVLLALQAENHFHHRDECRSAAGRRARSRLRSAFYPVEDASWRAAVLEHGREVVAATVERVGQPVG